MSEKRSKYDTDPLDQDFAARADDAWGATRAATPPRPTDEVVGNEQETVRLPHQPPAPEPQRAAAPPADAPTRRMDEQFSQSYPSVFIPPTYQPPPQQQQYAPPPQQQYAPPPGATYPTPDRTIAGLNISEKYATVLPYAPFYIGLVVAIVELLMVPRREVRTRFHAAQGLALHLAILAVSFLFTFINLFASTGPGSGLVRAAAFVFLIISMIRVWKGRPHRVGPLEDATRWLNERIDPRKN
ncbi:MAG TPA: hypothetical protein VF546_10020 [Pyrinomonadaceae bacterium]